MCFPTNLLENMYLLIKQQKQTAVCKRHTTSQKLEVAHAAKLLHLDHLQTSYCNDFETL